jgi:hypothetical protein
MQLNLTKKTHLKKFLLTENHYTLDDLYKIENGLMEIIQVLEEKAEAIRKKEEEKKAKLKKVIEALESEGVTFDELKSYIGKGKPKVKKTEPEKLNLDTADLKDYTEDSAINDIDSDLDELTEDNKLIS